MAGRAGLAGRQSRGRHPLRHERGRTRPLIKRHAPRDGTPITILSQEAGWRLGFGSWVEPLGLVKASRDNARKALTAGHLVIVLPGGDLDAAKPFSQRNRIIFGGRHGFVSIAMEAGVPIRPLVISGAGETAIVLSNGKRLASALGLPKRLRLNTLPINL